MKRLLSCLLCLSLLGGLFAAPAMALDDEPPVPEAEAVSEADTASVAEAPAAEGSPASAEPEEVLSEEDAGGHGSEEDIAPEEDAASDALSYALLEGVPENPVTSGTLEDGSIRWKVENGTLSISGTGAIPDFEDPTRTPGVPWFDCRALITKIVVEKGITAIGAYSFRNLVLATEVSLADSVTSIGEDAFYYCLSLTGLELPSSITELGDCAFQSCGNLTHITLPEGLRSIGGGVFSFVPLEELTLPSTLEQIGEAVCTPTATFTELTLPGSLRDIAPNAFVDMPNLKTVTVEEGITSLPAHCFGGGTTLETLNLPSTIETLGHEFARTYSENAVLSALNIAPQDDHSLVGWLDEAGIVYTTEDILDGVEYTGSLTALWYRTWDDGIFTDISDSSWFYDAVVFCYQAELMNGTGNDKFEPYDYGTRAQVVTVLYRLAGEPEVGSANSFKDISAGMWYTDAVAWACENGITTGYTDGTFRPNSYVTRQEFVTFLYRFTDSMDLIANDWTQDYTLDFTDVSKIQAWARPAENWSVAVGLQEGSPDTQNTGEYILKPEHCVERGEMAMFLYRYAVDLETMACIDFVYTLEGEPAGDCLPEEFGEPTSIKYETEDGVTYGLWYYEDYGFTVITVKDGNAEYICGVI